MRILHIVANPGLGGLERVVEGLAAGHRDAGLDPHVAAVVTNGGRPPMLDALERSGVPTHTLALGPRDYRGERRAVAALCDSLRPAVAHTHGYRADVVDAPAIRRAGIPSVTTVHGFTGGTWKNRLYEWLQIRSFRRFDAVVAVSAPLHRLLARRGVPEGRLRTIVNAWRPGPAPQPRAAARARLGLEAAGAVIGFVGRLTPEKGADVLLEAASRLPNAGLSIVGEGPERPALQAQAQALGVAQRVRWHGATPGAGNLLPAFDVLVLSSRTEGTPMVLFEAMAAGVPVVTTAVGGIPDVVTAQEALLVPAEDPEALATAIRSVLDDRTAAEGRAARARERLGERFAPGPWLEAYAALYRGVAAGKAGR